MRKRELKHLIGKFRNGSISPEELTQLHIYLDETGSAEDLSKIYDESETQVSAGQELPLVRSKEVLEGILKDERFLKENNKANRYKVKRLTVGMVAAAAACVALFLFWYLSPAGYFGEERTNSAHLAGKGNKIVPGGNKARILLADGSMLDLEKLKKDTTIYLEGFAIVKDKDGSVKYLAGGGTSEKEIYNTIVTPAGGQYNLELTDGTKILINASSSLKYPIALDGESRKVSLKGEAYFDVAKHRKNGLPTPFVVSTGTQTIEVLGTSFNVNSYKESIKTTLIEGSVRLSYEGIDRTHLLKPNEQATYSPGQKNVSIKKVDPLYSIAWKNGAFAFDNASIKEVMEEICRWYNVQAEFDQDMSKVFFTGTISRYEDITKLLNTIGLTGSVRFKIEGRRILVMR